MLWVIRKEDKESVSKKVWRIESFVPPAESVSTCIFPPLKKVHNFINNYLACGRSRSPVLEVNVDQVLGSLLLTLPRGCRRYDWPKLKWQNFIHAPCSIKVAAKSQNTRTLLKIY